jgi:hypothetical protein
MEKVKNIIKEYSLLIAVLPIVLTIVCSIKYLFSKKAEVE